MNDTASRYTFKADQFHEGEPHRFSQEASSLGLKPGEWPEEIKINGLGNGQPFVLISVTGNGNHRYGQTNGCVRVLIFND